MAKKNVSYSVKEFNGISKNAKKETKENFSSIYVICKNLESFSKGDYNKVNNVSFSNEDTKKVYDVLKTISTDKRAFSVSVLLNSKLYFWDYLGRLCYSVKCSQNEKANLLSGELVTDAKGRELRLNNNGLVIAYNPVTMTEDNILSIFANVAKVDIKAAAAAEKAAEKARKAAEKAEKQYKKAFAAVTALFGDIANLMTKEQIIEKYAIIKKTK